MFLSLWSYVTSNHLNGIIYYHIWTKIYRYCSFLVTVYHDGQNNDDAGHVAI